MLLLLFSIIDCNKIYVKFITLLSKYKKLNSKFNINLKKNDVMTKILFIN